MSVTNIDPQNVLPEMFLMDEIQTGSKSVLRNQLMDVNAVDNVQFTPGGTNQIRIKIVSPGDFLRGVESYLQFKLTLSGNQSTITNGMRLPLGGAHNLFSRVQVRTLGRGVILQEVDFYNEYQAIEHLFNIRKSFIEQFGPLYLEDTCTPNRSQTVKEGPWVVVPITSGAREIAEEHRAGLIVQYQIFGAVAIADCANFSVGGDVAIKANATGYTYYGCLAQLTPLDGQRLTVVIEWYGEAPNIAIAAGEANLYTWYARSNHGQLYTSQLPVNSGTLTGGNITADGGVSYNVVMQLALPICGMDIPLFVMKDGIEVLLDLNKATKAFTGLAVADYTIENVVYMCKFVTPHPQIQDSFQSMFESKKGLVYALPSVRVKQQLTQHNGGNISLFWNVGCRSVQRVLLKFTDSNIATLQGYDITMSHPVNISEYQAFVGSIQFPQRPVKLGYNGAEGWMQLLHSMGRMGTDDILASFKEYYTYPYANATTTRIGAVTRVDNNMLHAVRQANRFFIGIKFNRVDGYGRDLSGIDLSHVPLEIRLTVSGNTVYGLGALATGSLMPTLLAYYDAYWKLQKDQLAIYS